MVRTAGIGIMALLALGCGDGGQGGMSGAGDPVVAGVGAVVDVGSPAGAGSGQPHLAVGRDGSLLMSWTEPGAESGDAEVRFARYRDGSWGAPRVVTASPGLFVNWADFPSIIELSDGRLAVHWLQRSGQGRYAYDAYVAVSANDGETWSSPAPLHTDGTATEHGFVSLFEHAGGLSAIWLDGRRYARGDDGGPGTEEMTLQYTTVDGSGTPAPERLVDARVCDCCQTDAAMTAGGPIVVYRDRTETEIRDIVVSRLRNGEWTPAAPVHADGWEIPGCPVNGPAIAASGEQVVVAWFTAAGEVPVVRAAFSADAGATFGEPVRIDLGDPIGRVDALILGDGSALVSWLERRREVTDVLVRRVTPGGGLSAVTTIGESSDERPSGFPRVALAGRRVFFAWTVPGDSASVHVVSGALTGTD